MSRTQPIIVLAVMFLLSTTATAGGADIVYDGHYWRKCSVEEKRLFIHGVMVGVLLGQDRVIRYGQADRGAKALSPACQHAVVGVVNTLERQIEKWDRNGVLRALDAFYDDSGHLDLNLKWAVMVAMAQLQGAAPENVQDATGQNSDPRP